MDLTLYDIRRLGRILCRHNVDRQSAGQGEKPASDRVDQILGHCRHVFRAVHFPEALLRVQRCDRRFCLFECRFGFPTNRFRRLFLIVFFVCAGIKHLDIRLDRLGHIVQSAVRRLLLYEDALTGQLSDPLI